MKEQLQLLEELQEIDNQIDRYQGDLDRLPVEVQELARSLVVIRREMSEAREKSPEIEKELRRKESDLATEQEKIKRSERRLLTIRNQKEYNALSREVKLGKKVASEIEEAILNYMAEIETLKKTIDKKEKEYQELEKTFLKKKSESETAGAQAKEALVSLGKERERITSALEANLLKRYETVKQARGNGIAEVKNGSCMGCHMAIPPQLSIRVLKQEELITCPNCQRILYVKPENIPEYNKLDV
ncbi:MAG: zinc ribbon domain-containing protein [Desulfomonilaceae bacterium]